MLGNKLYISQFCSLHYLLQPKTCGSPGYLNSFDNQAFFFLISQHERDDKTGHERQETIQNTDKTKQ